jgi:hypothetical protein
MIHTILFQELFLAIHSYSSLRVLPRRKAFLSLPCCGVTVTIEARVIQIRVRSKK